MKNKRIFCGLVRFARRIFFCSILALHTALYAEGFFNFAEFKAANTFTLPTEETEKEKAVSANTGLKLSFRDFEVRDYVTLPKTTFSEISGCDSLSEKLGLFGAHRYGAGIFLFKNTFPLTIKAGKNTYSKSVSKMKNPSPSQTANPLTKSFAFSTGTGASLPTLSSSEQPLSFAASVSVPAEKFLFPVTADFFVTEEKTAAGTISSKFSVSRFIYFQVALSGARFYVENNTAVLSKNYADFSPGWFYSALSEVAFHSPILKIHGYAGFQQSPYDSNSVWLKIDGRTTCKIFLLDFSYFMIPTSGSAPKVAPLIGGSSSICRTVEQGSVNPQVSFLFDDKNASSVRVGFSALENWKVTSTNTPVLLNTLKMRTGAVFENRFLTVRADWTKADILLDGKPPTKGSTPEEHQTYAVSGSFAGKSLKTSLSASYSNYPPVTETSSLKETYSADFSLAIPKKNLTAKIGTDLTYKDKERYSGSMEMSATYAIKKKYFRSSLKLGVIMPF